MLFHRPGRPALIILASLALATASAASAEDRRTAEHARAAEALRRAWTIVASSPALAPILAPDSVPDPAAGPANPAPPAAARYIVQLADPPLAAYDGRLPGYPAAPADDSHLDVAAPSARAYAAYLDRQQAAFEAELRRVAPGARAQYHYRVAFNGVAVKLAPDQAAAAERLPGVVAVTREERIVPLMDASLGQIRAPAAWADGRVGGRAEAGRGVRIAVIDSGITAGHPFFAPAGFTAPPGFPTSTLTVGDQVTPYAAADVARYTNAKVIAARAYANPEVYDAAQPPTPLADGIAGFHGAHVAGTAAGVVTTAAPGSSAGTLDVSGVAPGAQVMAYKFSSAYTPEILRMIDDAVADGADVINNSWGTSAMNVMDADHHPVAQAFKAATAAGVVVVAAAGNAGTNGEATLGGPHQQIDEVITVGNVQTGRSFEFYLYARDTDLPADLEKHPAAYQAFDNDFSVIEGQAARGIDMCNPLALLIGARNKVILETTTGACAIQGMDLPIPEEFGFVTKLLIAGIANATAPVPVVKAVVFYAEQGDPAQLGAVLELLNTLKPLLQQAGINAKFPVTAVIAGEKAVALATYADTHPALVLKLDAAPTRILHPELVDAAHPTTGQGPTPPGGRGVGAPKPDLSAPGTDILSANTDGQGAPDGYVTASGTSMASPHVAGAAAVVRQAWPSWTPAEVKAALMTTADPVVTAGGALAPATVQGAGRLDLGRAVDPGLLVTPPSFALSRGPDPSAPAAGPGDPVTLTIRDVRLNPDEDVTYTVVEEPGTGPEPGAKLLALEPGATVRVPAGGRVTWRVPVDFDRPGMPAAPGAYDGRIALASATHTVRVVFRYVIPGDLKDVLLLSVRRSAAAGGPAVPGVPGGTQLTDTADYSDFWTAALDEAGLTYDVWAVADGAEDGAPPLSRLQRYDLVILAAGDGNAPLDQLAGGMTSLQMYLLGGGRMLVGGYNYPHGPGSPLLVQNNGAMYFLSRYFAGFERTGDDVAPAGVLAPVRLFGRPIKLAITASADAAGNGGKVDLGRPLAGLSTRATGGATALPLDQGIAAPMVVDRLMPYMRSFVEIDGGGSAMTGVTPDATLEHAARADFIPWLALFAGFGLEAVAPEPGHHTRAELLGRIHQWATEPADVAVEIQAPERVETGKPAVFVAASGSSSGVRVVGWRWDAGDRRPFVTTPEPELRVTYAWRGRYTVRVEALTEGGHTWVAEREVRVGGADRVFVPALARGVALEGAGRQLELPAFVDSDVLAEPSF